MINEIGWIGKFNIKVVNKLTGVIEETRFNRVMDVALDELIKCLQGQTTDLEIKYLALGTSNTPVTDSQTQLGNEIFRTPYISSEKTAVGELTTVFSALDAEAVGQIEEIGIFSGASATITPNSGKLISRILWSKNKTNLEEIQFTRIDRIVRG